MKASTKHLFFVAAAAALLTAASCSKPAESGLKVIKTSEALYKCSDGSSIKTAYYALSDNSLNFVKIFLNNSEEYTLPQLVSASGARYSDEHTLEFWIKGDSASLFTLDDNGEWVLSKEGTAASR